MDTVPWLWLLMTAGGAAVLGAALGLALIATRRRRENPVAQRLSDAATKEVYRQEEVEREREETR